MTATHRKLVHEMKRLVKIAYDAQCIASLSAEELSALDDIMAIALDISGAEDLTISQFLKEDV